MQSRGTLTPGVVATLCPLLLGLLLLAGCTGSGSDTSRPTPASGRTSTTPSPTPSPTSTPSAAQALAPLASRAAAARYSATYRLTPGKDGKKRTVHFARNSRGYRFQLTTGAVTTLLEANGAGTFECTTGNGPPACARLGGPTVTPRGDRNPILQHAFTDWPKALGTPSAHYRVTSAAGSGLSGRCFAIRHTASTGANAVAAGTYCFAADGVVTGLRYPSGTLTLAARSGPPDRLPLPATPSPLPH